jgi:hypothetical protein
MEEEDMSNKKREERHEEEKQHEEQLETLAAQPLETTNGSRSLLPWP